MRSSKPRIVVVGSLVMDLVFRARRRPGPGETFLGSEFGMFLGGKGFNQAVGARRLGADVALVGRLGNDYFGGLFLEKLGAEGISSRYVRRDPEAGTGVASPVIDEHGQNSIIGVPRANMLVTEEDVEAAGDEIGRADVLMLQFEIPVAASARAAEIARRHGTTVLLDPAPVHYQEGVPGVEGSRIQVQADYIVPNVVEAQMLTGRTTPEEAAALLLPEARRAVVISLGERGAFAVDRGRMLESSGFAVRVVDTTGAGDAFRAGLAVMLAEARDLETSVRFANACGALACTVMGAEPSMPTRRVVEAFLAATPPAAGSCRSDIRVARPDSPSEAGSRRNDLQVARPDSPSGDGSYRRDTGSPREAGSGGTGQRPCRGHRQLRKGRASQQGSYYFVTICCDRSRALFTSEPVVRPVFDCLRWMDEQEWIDLHCCVVMPDHVHIVFQLTGPKALSDVVRSFKLRTTRELGTPVWQRQYYDHAIRSDESLTDIVRYCWHNPVRAGLVKEPRDYPFWWSKHEM